MNILLQTKREKALEMVGKKIELGFAQSKAISINEKDKTAIFVMSTSNIDRHGDIVDQDSWILDHFTNNPAFFFQHRSQDMPIGRWLKVWLEADPDNIGQQRLVGEAKFSIEISDIANEAWLHVLEGNLNMVSVGFIPHRVDYDETRDAFILYDCELMECSLVGIGSNRQALIKDKEVIIETLIDTKEFIDKEIKKSNNTLVINHFKKIENINKAIRKIKNF